MKCIHLLLVCGSLTGICNPSLSQTFLFKESFGTPAYEKTEVLSKHVWDNDSSTGIGYRWTANDPVAPDSVGSLNVRSNKSSTNYSFATGNGNLYFNSSDVNTFVVTGIRTAGYKLLSLSMGVFGKSQGDVTRLVLKYELDESGTWTTVGQTEIAALSAAAGVWEALSDISIPESSRLSLEISTPQKGEIRIDDIRLTAQQTTDYRAASQDSAIKLYGHSVQINDGAITEYSLYNVTGLKLQAGSIGPGSTISLPDGHGCYILKTTALTLKIVL